MYLIVFHLFHHVQYIIPFWKKNNCNPIILYVTHTYIRVLYIFTLSVFETMISCFSFSSMRTTCCGKVFLSPTKKKQLLFSSSFLKPSYLTPCATRFSASCFSTGVPEERLPLSFNTSGPSIPELHYYLDPLTIFRGTSGSSTFDFSKTKELILDEKYFLLHGPRQSMKTSYLLAVQDHLNTHLGDHFHCVYASLEKIQDSTT